MRNKLIITMMVLLMSFAGTTQIFAAKKDTPKTLPAKNSSVSVTMGKNFIVELKDSEGKSWSYIITNSEERVILEAAFEPSDDGTRKWMFMGTAPGQCSLIFTCADASGAESKTITYTVTVSEEPELIEKVSVKKGKTFTIALEQNPSTGYSWEYTLEPAEGMELVSDNTVENDRKGAAGAPSKRIYTFKCTQKGRYIAVFTYSKPFAPDDNPQKVKYEITVK